jgi:hypothetical protein
MNLIKEIEYKNQSLHKRLMELEDINKNLKTALTPLVARIFPELISNDLVGVQPMMAPAGLAYALRYRYITPQDKKEIEENGY